MGSSPPSTPSPTPSSFHPISAPIHPRPLTDSRCERTSRQRKGKKPAPLPFPPSEKETEGPAPQKSREKQRGAPKRHSPPLLPSFSGYAAVGGGKEGGTPISSSSFSSSDTPRASIPPPPPFAFLQSVRQCQARRESQGPPSSWASSAPLGPVLYFFSFSPPYSLNTRSPFLRCCCRGKWSGRGKALSLFRGGSGGLGGVPRNMKRAGEEAGSATRDGGEGRGSSRILTEEKEA